MNTSVITNNATWRNHYVPQCLLENFTDSGGVLWTYDTELNKCWEGNTRSSGYMRDLYPQAVENHLAASIDAPGSRAITNLLQHKKLESDEYTSFLRFVAAQMQRTPSCFSRIEKFTRPFLQETFDHMAKYDPEFREKVTAKLEAADTSLEDISEIFTAMGNGDVSIKPSHDFILAIALSAMDSIVDILHDMDWLFFDVPDGDPDLIIGDHVVMLTVDDADNGPSPPIGLLDPNIELAIPISKRMVGLAYRNSSSSYGTLLKGEAARINDRTLSYAYRRVFASRNSSELLARAIKLRNTGPRTRVKRIQFGKQLLITHCYT